MAISFNDDVEVCILKFLTNLIKDVIASRCSEYNSIILSQVAYDEKIRLGCNTHTVSHYGISDEK